VHVAAFVVVLVVPAGHDVHWRLEEALGCPLTKEPGTQTVQGAHVSAFVVVLKVPPVHVAHVRFVTALPSAATDWPAVQSVHATQAVAELPSWSQVCPVQATFGISPPAQYVPASHGEQEAGDVGVAGAICSVPAAHAPTGWQLGSLGNEVYVPGPHTSHVRFVKVVPSAVTWLPGLHVAHGVQSIAFGVVL
jgi:hypothetical protein